MALDRINPKDVHPPMGYSHVVRAGKLVYIAGQVPLDESGNLVGKGDIGAQMELVCLNIQKCLASADASFADVVKITTYMTHREDIEAMRPIRIKYFGNALPSSTLVLISGLANPDFRVEIEAIAVLP